MADRQQNDFPASNDAAIEDLQLGGGDLDADLDGGEPDAAGLDQAEADVEGRDFQTAGRIADVDDEDDVQRAETLRRGLRDYDLEDEDLDLLEAAAEGPEGITYLPALPVLAIVGRPNVGKSALVNRILGRREAVVEDVPGVTRDRVSYKAEWNGRRFTLVDTGGWEPDAKGINASVAQQAEIAVELADAVLFVVDANVGATSTDEHVVRMLRKTKKPVLLAANKIDDARQEPNAANLWSLGLGEPRPVSALHGRGVADLLDEVLRVLPEISAVAKEEVGGPRRVAILGRPNVGKSSLLNKAVGEERVVVNDLAGTTRDPVDEQVEIAGKVWRFVDTAGIRRRVRQASGAEFYSSLRTSAALEKAEVAVVLIDVSDVISEQDVRIIDLVLESGRALVLAFNKWDLLDDERRRYLEREIEQDLAHVAWAPRVNISARTGRHMEKLVPALELALQSWDTRIPTGKFNAFLAELVAEHPHPVRSGKQPRILFGTQASTRPPTFVLFTSEFLDPQYRRFITRRLRETYGFEGSPINVNMRVREKRKR
ncbi:ribosome biogenesis GTPase Der [Microbacteriaceae bacterium 4G12]